MLAWTDERRVALHYNAPGKSIQKVVGFGFPDRTPPPFWGKLMVADRQGVGSS